MTLLLSVFFATTVTFATNQIYCNSESTCKCPNNGPCSAICGSAYGCHCTTIDCPSDYSCYVECGGGDSCNGTIINCPSNKNSTCGLSCGGGESCAGVYIDTNNNSVTCVFYIDGHEEYESGCKYENDTVSRNVYQYFHQCISKAPTYSPTTPFPTAITSNPTRDPSKQPSISPTDTPSKLPSISPTNSTIQPTISPTDTPSKLPSISPSDAPTEEQEIVINSNATILIILICICIIFILIDIVYRVKSAMNAGRWRNARHRELLLDLQDDVNNATVSLMPPQEDQPEGVGSHNAMTNDSDYH